MHFTYEAASTWFDVANAFLVLALIIGVVATYLIYITGNVKEDYVKERLAESHGRAAKLEQEAAEARERTASLELEAEIIQKDNLTLQTNLETERIARLKLEAAVAPRAITPEQKATLITAWRRFAGRRVSVSSYSMDAEAALLGQQIISGLRDAGLTVVEGLTTVVPIGGLSLGIHVTAGTDRALAHGLAEAIGQNTALVVTYNPQAPAGGAQMILGGAEGRQVEATILVGVKPIATR